MGRLRRRRPALILPDVNVLVGAYRREVPHHDRYAAWLGELVAGADDLALVESTLTGFVRVVTNPRIFADTAPTASAVDFVDALRDAPRSRWLVPTSAAWDAFRSISQTDLQVRGNLVPDAWLATLALSHGCRIATADRGFARFEGLNWFDPAG